MPPRRGTTLVEQCAALALLTILLVLGLHGVTTLRDRLAVRSAVREARAVFALAREHAVASGRRTAVHMFENAGAMVAHAESDSLHHVALRGRYGVELHTTRDSMAYASSGLGHGASNLTLRIGRGVIEDTIAVSRLGRVR